jgi:hypothetical protein
MLNDVYKCLYNGMKYKYDNLQKLKIKGYDYKDLNYKIHLDAELIYYYVVFGFFMYCYCYWCYIMWTSNRTRYEKR